MTLDGRQAARVLGPPLDLPPPLAALPRSLAGHAPRMGGG